MKNEKQILEDRLTQIKTSTTTSAISSILSPKKFPIVSKRP